MLVWELTLYNAVFRHVQCHSELIFFKYPTSFKMPKAHRKSGADEDNDIPLHGTTNEEEAKNYSKGLDSIVIQMGRT